MKDFLSGSGVAFRECGFHKEEKQILDVYFQEVKKFDIWGRLESLLEKKFKGLGSRYNLKGPNSGHKFFDILGNRVPLTHVYIQNFDFELGLPEISQKC